MPIVVVAKSKPDFARWLADEQAKANPPAAAPAPASTAAAPKTRSDCEPTAGKPATVKQG